MRPLLSVAALALLAACTPPALREEAGYDPSFGAGATPYGTLQPQTAMPPVQSNQAIPSSEINSALFGTPMINAPQAGILGVYSISKTPVIIDDMIAIRSIMHMVLTYDHRLIDGMIAGKFLASVRDRLQKFDFFK